LNSITVNGVIKGNGGIRDAFSAFIHLNGDNTFSGGTNMLGGTYFLGHDNALGTGTIWNSTAGSGLRSNGGARTIANNMHIMADMAFGGTDAMTFNGNFSLAGGGPRTLTVNTTNGVTLGGVVEGGSLTKAGPGTLTLASSTGNTYTGTTIVTGGKLVVNNTTGSGTGIGNVTVNANTILGGTGSMSGAVTVNGTLSPGESIESLASGALTMNSGSTFVWETLDNSATGADLMVVNGQLTLNNVNLDLSLANLSAGTWNPGDKLTLLSYTGNALTSGFVGFVNLVQYTFGANDWIFQYDDTIAGSNYASEATGTFFVTFTAVPEPTALLLVSSLIGLTGFRRRRKSIC
jgi:autotransporter-associated beta strand protein